MKPIKTGVCAGCRAQSYKKCNGCAYMLEGLVEQINVDTLMGPMDPREDAIENSASESQQGSADTSTDGNDTAHALSPA